MAFESTRHGLSVLSGANADGRLRRPVDEAISNCFNDATSGNYYNHSAGHEGIDFDSPVGTDVRAMYGGQVVRIEDTYQSDSANYGAYGLYVTIESDLGNGQGFRHTYAHLAHPKDFLIRPDEDPGPGNYKGAAGQAHYGKALKKEIWNTETCTFLLDEDGESQYEAIAIGNTICKGQMIGLSGTTGTVIRHLHVHLKPFGTSGAVTSDNNPPVCGNRYFPDKTQETVVANRILGCMNFSCFLPFDEQEEVDGHTHVPAPIDSNSRKRLLSPRDANARIPVYGDDNGARGSNTGRVIHGKYLAYYEVKGEGQYGNATWYRIQYEAGTAGVRWVPGRGEVNGIETVWVQVEDYSLATLLALPFPPAVITHVEGVSVYDRAGTNGERLGTLKKNTRYSLVGQWNNWWQIRYGTDAEGNPRPGWVQVGGAVRTCGNTDAIPTVTLPAADTTAPPALALWLEVNVGITQLNVRAAPNTDAATAVKRQIAERQRYPILGEQGHWWQIRYGTGTEEVGWVANHAPGTDGSHPFVTVDYKPPLPWDLKDPELDGREVTLRWQAPRVPDSISLAVTRLSGYQLWGAEPGAPRQHLQNLAGTSESTTVTLPAGVTRYQFQLAGVNENELGDAVNFDEVRVPAESELSAPTLSPVPVPGLPVGITAMVTGSQVCLAWRGTRRRPLNTPSRCGPIRWGPCCITRWPPEPRSTT